MARPSKKASSKPPYTRRNNQPKYTSEDLAVIDLSDPRYEEAQNRGHARISYLSHVFHTLVYEKCPSESSNFIADGPRFDLLKGFAFERQLVRIKNHLPG